MSLRIENDGPRIVRTNYWSTEHARRGYCYLSWNAGVLRVLVPDLIAADLVHGASCAPLAIVSRGPLHPGRAGFEVLFDDGSDSPYALHVLEAQADRSWMPGDERRRDLICAIWAPDGSAEGSRLALELPLRLRTVALLPCLDPWVEPS